MSAATLPGTSDNTGDIPGLRPPLVARDLTMDDVTELICSVPEGRRTPLVWYVALAISMCAMGVFILAVIYEIFTGIGTFGNNIPVAWGFPITNFVWWVGIGHAGTLISAILLLLRQEWRNSINRFAEAMTIFAVMCAGMFPLIHLGRCWFAYWLLPYPNEMRIWPQFLCPLVWDCYAVGTYFTVSVIFWYMGMLPDLASLRDHAQRPTQKKVYAWMALGWRNSARHWKMYRTTYMILAALATPLVLSVHSVVSFDFAAAQLPGWHETIFPPYFVAGAIFSGFAMVITLTIPIRSWFKLHSIVTARHMENMAIFLTIFSGMMLFSYVMEYFTAYYSHDKFELTTALSQYFGPFRDVTYTVMACNLLVPQLFWFRWARHNMAVLFIASILVNVGMWLERYLIVVASLNRDFLPSSWFIYHPTYIDISMFLGSLGLFLTCFLLFCRFFPMSSIAEIKELPAVVEMQRQPEGVPV